MVGSGREWPQKREVGTTCQWQVVGTRGKWWAVAAASGRCECWAPEANGGWRSQVAGGSAGHRRQAVGILAKGDWWAADANGGRSKRWVPEATKEKENNQPEGAVMAAAGGGGSSSQRPMRKYQKRKKEKQPTGGGCEGGRRRWWQF